MPPTITPQQFVAKWRGDARKERSVAQEHVIDLCRLLGHETPGETRDGSRAFEAGVDTQKGGQGWADVWKKGAFAWEYNGPHADLAKADQQIQQYRESLHNPPLLVVCDIQQIVIHTNFTNTITRDFTITLDELLTPAGQQRLRDVFYAPEAFRAPVSTEQVTTQYLPIERCPKEHSYDPRRTGRRPQGTRPPLASSRYRPPRLPSRAARASDRRDTRRRAARESRKEDKTRAGCAIVSETLMDAKTILIVDDDQALVQILDELLRAEGYRTLRAGHGGEALAILSTTLPDLIVTDLMMPVLDGFALCRAVLANRATQAIPLVLISGFERALQLVDFPHASMVRKPFDRDELLNVVVALIGTPSAQAS
jgi:CheY-like chemotaxis protein